ncbi:MAG: sensor N-terminal transmembrane domain-containing protein [Caulobacteraceae bacterium]|nr:sensor N-terminal transmembrane domain-containing protein [Caulobacter sp.]
MASATATASPEGRLGEREGRRAALRRHLRSRFAASKLGALVLGLNLAGLLVLIIGALVLNELRHGLLQARQDSLTTQGELISLVLVQAATVGEPAPALDAERAAYTLQLLKLPSSERARLYDAQGRLIADTDVIADKVLSAPLPPVRPRVGPLAWWGGLQERWAERRAVRAHGVEQREVAAALTGRRVAEVRDTEANGRVVSVSIPLQHVQAVLGVLQIESGDVEATVWAQRRALLPFILIAVGASLVSSILLYTLVATPIERLARAADSVRLSRARTISLPDLAEREDEVGGLTRALESMTDAQSARMDAIERFAADVAHEIKNPLTSMRSALETLELAPAAHPGRVRLMGVLKNDVQRLDRLITDIANSSRLDAELSRESPRVVDLGRLLQDMAELHPEGAGVPVRVAGAAGGPYRVAGREGPLGQVFRNLIDNARSFSPPEAAVRVSLARQGGERARVVVRVDDDGPGIPPENLATVFQRFYTNRPRSSAPGGSAFGGHSGLGLSIASQVVEAHGGTIAAENRLGPDGAVAGARFVVRLPEAPR